MHPSYDQLPFAIERSLVQLATVLAATASAGFVISGLLSGNETTALGAIGPTLVAIAGLAMLRRHAPRILPILLSIALAITVQNYLLPFDPLAHLAILPLAIVGIIGALFVPQRLAIVYIAGYSILIFINLIEWGAAEVPALQAITGTVAVAFGATLLAGVRREFGRREERYRNLFEHAPISLWKEDFTAVESELSALTTAGVSNLEGYLQSNPEEVRRLAALVTVTDVNEAALLLTEAPDRVLLLGNFGMETFSRGALESFIPQFLATADGEEKVSVELKGGLTMTGRPIEALLVWSAPVVDGERDLSNVTVAIIDVTRQREAERKLQRLIDSQSQFVATISHELRTPLTAVVGIAQELRDESSLIDDAERSELLGLVADQSLEASRIVEDLLVAARADAGNLIVESRPVDLSVEAEAVTHAIDPDIPVEVNGHPEVIADPHRVRQIIRNMVTNARRYGGPNARVIIDSDGPNGILEVRDDGEPLAPSSRAAIFEPYTRARQREGTTASVGLGLTVSRRLARHMGGDLVYDHDGHETIFRMTLVAVPVTATVS